MPQSRAPVFRRLADPSSTPSSRLSCSTRQPIRETTSGFGNSPCEYLLLFCCRRGTIFELREPVERPDFNECAYEEGSGLVNAAFAMGNIQIATISASEVQNPRQNVPKAMRRVLCVIYTLLPCQAK